MANAVSEDPSHYQAYEQAAKIYIDDERYDFARDILHHEINLTQARPEAYFLLGYVSFKKGDYTSAQDYLEVTLGLDPDNQAAQENLQMVQEIQ